MSEADLYRKQRVALENIARIIMRQEAEIPVPDSQTTSEPGVPESVS